MVDSDRVHPMPDKLSRVRGTWTICPPAHTLCGRFIVGVSQPQAMYAKRFIPSQVWPYVPPAAARREL